MRPPAVCLDAIDGKTSQRKNQGAEINARILTFTRRKRALNANMRVLPTNP